MSDAEDRRLAKAERALAGAARDLSAGDAGLASDRAYYAMFHAADALLSDRDKTFRSHGAVHGAFGKEFAKTGIIDPKYHRWILDAFRLRQEMVYDLDAEADAEAAAAVVERAREFVGVARSYFEERR